MKKNLLLVVLFMFFLIGITGCGNDNSIKLTKDNYEKYLNVKVGCYTNDFESAYRIKGVKLTDTYTATMLYSSITGNLTVQGASTNFNYNDVKVVIRIFGTYKAFDKEGDYKDTVTKNFEMTLESTPNISGNDKTIIEHFDLDNNLLTHEYLLDYDYEIVEITGSVTPAK